MQHNATDIKLLVTTHDRILHADVSILGDDRQERKAVGGFPPALLITRAQEMSLRCLWSEVNMWAADIRKFRIPDLGSVYLTQELEPSR